MARHAIKLITDGNQKSSLRKVYDAKGDLDAKDVNEARKAGDVVAGEVWNRSAYYLALGCVSICRLLDPSQIILAGGLIKAGNDLLKPVTAHFRRQHWQLTDVETRIALAKLGTDAGVIGAAGVAWAAADKKGC